MAPTTTIETITITRPLKVIAFICGVIVVFLMIMALASTDWLLSDGYRQGLFVFCIEDDAQDPRPFNIENPPGCYSGRDTVYIQVAAAFCILTLITDVVATVLTGLGLKTQNHNLKYKFYKIAVLVMLVSLILVLAALIIYPVCFAGELNLEDNADYDSTTQPMLNLAQDDDDQNDSKNDDDDDDDDDIANRPVWEFGWAYGVGWGAAIFLFGGVVLLLCDKESEEIYYKERKIVHDNQMLA